VGYYMTAGVSHGFLLSWEDEDDGQDNDGGHDDGGR